MIANLLDKQEKLYPVPSTKKENELLAGIILNDEIIYLLKFSKASDNIYTLYNETNEPICDVKYDFEKQTIKIKSDIDYIGFYRFFTLSTLQYLFPEHKLSLFSNS